MYINRFVRIIKYWFKVIHSENCIIKASYINSLKDCNSGKPNWASGVKSLLYQHGFGDTWENPHSVNAKHFCQIFKARLIDIFRQQWNMDVNTNSKLQLYKHCKDTFGYEEYLNIVSHKHIRYGLTRLRLSSHQLRVETGRYGRNRTPRDERYCLQCNTGDIEDEYHFVCVCPIYNYLRENYIPAFYRRNISVLKFVNLLKSNKKIHVRNRAMFISHACKVRTRLGQE